MMKFSLKCNSLILLCSIFVAISLTGCVEEPVNTPVVKKKPAIKKKVSSPVKKEKIVKKERAKIKFAYDPSGKRDPFLPYLSSFAIEGVPEENIVLTELQKYELSQLKLVVVMNIGGRGIAQVETPDGLGHTIYLGTLIGKNKGKVVAIKGGKVTIEEKFRDILGDIKSTLNEIAIENPDGGIKL